MMPQAGREEELCRYWDKDARYCRKQIGFFDRHLLAGGRDWICSRATGHVLEVAIGTGLNLAHYPVGVQLTGVEWSPAMLDIARHRAGQLGREVDTRHGDGKGLALHDWTIDTRVGTLL